MCSTSCGTHRLSIITAAIFVGTMAPANVTFALPDDMLGYDSVLVPPFPGETRLSVRAMDDYGRVVGVSGSIKAVIWVNGTHYEFDDGTGNEFPARVESISPSSGVVVGNADYGLHRRPIVWTRTNRYFPDVPFGAADARPYAVNDFGWMAGQTGLPVLPVLWRLGQEPIALGPLPGSDDDSGGQRREPFSISSGLRVPLGGVPGRWRV